MRKIQCKLLPALLHRMLSFSGEGEAMLEWEDPILEEVSFSDSCNANNRGLQHDILQPWISWDLLRKFIL